MIRNRVRRVASGGWSCARRFGTRASRIASLAVLAALPRAIGAQHLLVRPFLPRDKPVAGPQ